MGFAAPNRKVTSCIGQVVILALVAGVFSVAAIEAHAAFVYVSPSGNDSASGTSEEEPLKTVAEAYNRVTADDSIVFLAGEFPVTSEIQIRKSGILLKAKERRTATLLMDAPFRVYEAGVTFRGLILDGRFVGGRAIQGVSWAAHQLTIDDCEVTRFTNHAIDIDGMDNVVQNSHIHHILRWDGGRVDAHGIVSTSGRNLRISNTEIHHVSGDSFQAERGAWEDIVIEDCHFWDGPLEGDMAGFSKGDIPAENAIDTKRGWRERSKLTLRRCNFHGFRSSFISNAAALNLKEAVDVVVDSCSIYDSYIALRLRGKSSKSELKMQASIINSEIYGNEIMMRHEDDLDYCKFLHNTLYNNIQLYVRAPASTNWGAEWATINNLFIGITELPQEASDQSRGAQNNLILSWDQVDTRKIPLVGGSAVEIVGQAPSWYQPEGRVLLDKAGTTRLTPSTVGAYEFGSSEPPAPVAPRNLRLDEVM